MRWNALALLITAALTLACGSGCTSVRVYDLSATPPFSAYAGKEVILTRDVLVVDTSKPQIPQRYCTIVDPALPDNANSTATAREARESFRIIRVPAGTKVRVDTTRLTSSRNIYAEFWNLGSQVSISGLQAEGWPTTVEAGFNHASIPY